MILGLNDFMQFYLSTERNLIAELSAKEIETGKQNSDISLYFIEFHHVSNI